MARDDDRRHRRSASAPRAKPHRRAADRARARRPVRRGRRTACRRSTSVNLKVKAGEIVGIAGVSGNGQKELVEVLAGQRPLTRRRASSSTASPSSRRARHCDRFKVFGLPEEPLKNAIVPQHERGREPGVPHLRQAADRHARLVAVARRRCATRPRELIAQYQGQDRLARRADRDAVGRQRAARRAGPRADRRRRRADRRQPCFGLDFASVAEIRARSWSAQPRRRRAAGLARTSTRSSSSPTASPVMSGGTHRLRDADRRRPTAPRSAQHMAGHH